ncbi:B-cadherin-like isoform X1 [Arapaima gigas]
MGTKGVTGRVGGECGVRRTASLSGDLMEYLRVTALLLFVSLQVFGLEVRKEHPECDSGFTSKTFVFTVHSVHLHKNKKLGKAIFDDCRGRQRAAFSTDDPRFKVTPNGMISTKTRINLQYEYNSFHVHAWNSEGKKDTTRILVQYQPKSSLHRNEVHSAPSAQADAMQSVPLLYFPRSSSGLKRRKRDWIIPPIKIEENQKGPFPKAVVKIRSSNDKEAQMLYSITGQGADQPPKGLFTMDKNSGQLFVASSYANVPVPVSCFSNLLLLLPPEPACKGILFSRLHLKDTLHTGRKE